MGANVVCYICRKVVKKELAKGITSGIYKYKDDYIYVYVCLEHVPK